ncbi:MAG: methyltransferase [Chloroflexi bacterium]|nr:MAG: methyltransferase [Chloroflexota bacterium]
MMSPQRVRRLRKWHDEAYREMQESLPLRIFHMGLELRVPEDVFPPAGDGSFHRLIRDEVRPSDRVLDMGTGSGIGALLAASQSSEVVAVDINPRAVEAAAANAVRNGVAERITFLESDVFAAVDGTFDLLLFDPPFRWFKARDLLELGTADENYRALTTFMTRARQYLRPGGRILLHFGTSGDIDYLYQLIDAAGLKKEVLATEQLTRDDLAVTYYVFRLTP